MPDSSTTTSKNHAVGVDLGVKTLVTLSDGKEIPGSKAGRKYEKKQRIAKCELTIKLKCRESHGVSLWRVLALATL